MRASLLTALIIVLNFSTLNLFAQCEEMLENFSHEYFGEHVLTGTSVLIPEVKLRVTSRTTSEIMPLQVVRLRYMWKHVEAPSGKYPRGVWDEAYDVIACKTDENGIVKFTEYNVIPKGWYDSPKLGRNVPKFLNLELSVENHHLWITEKQVKQIRNKKIKKPIELKDPSGYVAPIKVEIIP